jgi:putative transposase
MRHTTFRFALAPDQAQLAMLVRHAGASRFAYNQCLELVGAAHRAHATDPSTAVPWSGYDLINAFNGWKRSESAGRIFVAAPDGTVTKKVTGLPWRRDVAAQVFEEAAVDFGRAFAAYAQASTGDGESGSGFLGASAKGAVATASVSATNSGRMAPSASASEWDIPAR